MSENRKPGGQPPRAPLNIENDQNVKRRAGGQPGNHNALKHGRYITKANLLAIHVSDEEQITVIDHLIRSIKLQMDRAAELRKKSQTTAEILKTMNSLSMAAIGLCRLSHLYKKMTYLPVESFSAGDQVDPNEIIANLLIFMKESLTLR